MERSNRDVCALLPTFFFLLLLPFSFLLPSLALTGHTRLSFERISNDFKYYGETLSPVGNSSTLCVRRGAYFSTCFLYRIVSRAENFLHIILCSFKPGKPKKRRFLSQYRNYITSYNTDHALIPARNCNIQMLN